MDGVFAGVIVPYVALLDSVPLLLCTVEGNACKAPATGERTFTYARYAISNRYACKATAIVERTIAYDR